LLRHLANAGSIVAGASRLTSFCLVSISRRFAQVAQGRWRFVQDRGRLIGGVFGLAELRDTASTPIPFLKDTHILLANASSGLALLVERLRPSQVWLPSYLCGSLLQAVGKARTTVRFYGVESDLTSEPSGLDEVGDNDMVVVIDYFGFPNALLTTLGGLAHRAWIVEDASHALLTGTVGLHADFVLFSPRKFLGVPDGGILVSKEPAGWEDVVLNAPPARWWLTALAATARRGEFDRRGGSREWFDLFRESEANQPIGAYRMSELSEMILTHSFDYAEIGLKRRENYRHLAESLGRIALFPELEEGVVPLGFPIRVGERDAVRRRLFDQDIYPPVHWSLSGIIPERFAESHLLSAEILTLPCDQRYGRQDMERMARAVLSSPQVGRTFRPI
jgi:dTDP-4-amino-4,6-dideoxygalactose transaminase